MLPAERHWGEAVVPEGRAAELCGEVALCRTGEKQAVMAEQAVEPGPFLTSLLL